MEARQALQEGTSYLRNGQDIAGRSPVNPDTLYMWDNQVQAIETFLANSEDLADEDPQLAQLRKDLREVKKQIELKVLEFELKQEGQELPPEPTEDEIVADMLEYATEIRKVVAKVGNAKVARIEQLRALDDERAQVDNFLVETEPLVGKDSTLDAVRAEAKATKAAVDAAAREFLKVWQASDAADEDDE